MLFIMICNNVDDRNAQKQPDKTQLPQRQSQILHSSEEKYLRRQEKKNTEE